MLFPMVAKEGVNTPEALVAAVTLQVPPAGMAVKLKLEEFEQTGPTAVMVGIAGMVMEILVVPTFEQVGAAVGVTTTV